MYHKSDLMKKLFYFCGFLFLGLIDLQAQITLYTADFTTVHGFTHTTSNPPPAAPATSAGVNYTLGYTNNPSTDGSSNYFRSDGTLIESGDFGGAAYFITDLINISSVSDFTIDGVGNTVGASVFNGSSEQFQWSYRIDGGTWVTGPMITSDGSLNTPASWTNISTAGGSDLEVRFEFNINGAGDGFDITQVQVTGTSAASPNDQDSDVSTPISQVAVKTITADQVTTSGAAEDVFTFTVTDFGTSDGLPTNITQIEIVPGGTNNADWTDHIQGVLIDDGSSFVTIANTNITDNAITIDFASGDLSVADGAAIDVTLWVYLNTSNITDGAILAFEVPASHNFQADLSTGSGFAPTFFFAPVIGNDITIDVDANQLVFLQQPTSVNPNTIMTPAVEVAYADPNGNVDIDYDGSGFDIQLSVSGSAFAGTVTNPVTASQGIAVFNDLEFTTLGNGVTLTATDASTFIPGSFPSSAFDVVALPTLVISEVADPSNVFDARFVEIYNYGATSVDLSAEQIHLVRQANGSGLADIALTGTLEAGQVFIIAGNISNTFNTTFGFSADVDNGNVSGNGDDGYFLYYGGNSSTGTLLDAYGVLNQDGTGQPWEYEDSRAIRNNPQSASPTATWNAADWTISSAATGDCTPGALENEFRYDAAAWKPRDISNWTAGDDVIIQDDYTSSADFSADNLEVRNSFTITIAAGHTLTVNGDIENDGDVEILSSGSLVQTATADNNSGSGTYAVERSKTHGDFRRFTYWASPIAGETMGDAFPNSDVLDFHAYDANAQAFTADGVINASSAMTAGRGYASTPDETTTTTTLIPVTETTVFDGSSVHNGPIDYAVGNVTGTRYILAGNPYPSAIDAEDFLTANSGLVGTIWYWDHSGPVNDVTYASWTTAGGVASHSVAPDDFIQVAQGFMVQATNTGSPTLSFTNSMRLAGNNNQFFKSETRERFWLNLSKDTSASQNLMIALMDNASDAYDNGMDGEILKASQSASFYSLLPDAREMSIQALAKMNPGETKIIPLGIDAWLTGNFEIALDSINNWPAHHGIYLLDSAQGKSVDLQQQSYNFAVNQTGAIHGRFYLLIGENTVGLEESSRSGEFTYYQREGSLEMNDALSQWQPRTVALYSLNGNLLRSSAWPQGAESHRLSTANLAQGVYLLQVEAQNGRVHNHKIYLR